MGGEGRASEVLEDLRLATDCIHVVEVFGGDGQSLLVRPVVELPSLADRLALLILTVAVPAHERWHLRAAHAIDQLVFRPHRRLIEPRIRHRPGRGRDAVGQTVGARILTHRRQIINPLLLLGHELLVAALERNGKLLPIQICTVVCEAERLGKLLCHLEFLVFIERHAVSSAQVLGHA